MYNGLVTDDECTGLMKNNSSESLHRQSVMSGVLNLNSLANRRCGAK